MYNSGDWKGVIGPNNLYSASRLEGIHKEVYIFFYVLTVWALKHGGRVAVVIPSEFAQLLPSDEVTLEFTVDGNNNPRLIVKPTNELDTIDEGPLFCPVYTRNLQECDENPHTLKDGSELNERVMKLIEGVDTDDEEE